VVIEAGVVAGYVIAWACRKARRVGVRLDSEADGVIDASLDRLHEVVEARLDGHPALAELVKEAEASGEVSEQTRQQVELALAAEAREDDDFGRTVSEIARRIQEAGRASGQTVIAGAGSAVVAGNADIRADRGGIAVGQVAGDMTISPDPPGPPEPGRPRH
jgi:hypothetical protein